MTAGAIHDVAFGIVVTSAFALLVTEVVRERRPEAHWWQVLAEIKARPMEWPLFVSALALIGVAEAGTHGEWWLTLALPVYGFLGWYFRTHPRFARVETELPSWDTHPVPEPPSHVRTLDAKPPSGGDR